MDSQIGLFTQTSRELLYLILLELELRADNGKEFGICSFRTAIVLCEIHELLHNKLVSFLVPDDLSNNLQCAPVLQLTFGQFLSIT